MFSSICLVLAAISFKFCSLTCYNHFPKYLGAQGNGTRFTDIDANKDTIYACGFTHSDELTGLVPQDVNPIIVAYDVESSQIKWGWFDKSK
jgi:hypothetical protein